MISSGKFRTSLSHPSHSTDYTLCRLCRLTCDRDVSRSAKELKKAFKQCESPYRRGVVSVEQFQVSEATNLSWTLLILGLMGVPPPRSCREVLIHRAIVCILKTPQEVCLKNGVTVDREDIDFLLRLHRYVVLLGWARLQICGSMP